MHQVDDERREELVGVRQAACRRLLEQIDVDEITLDVDATLLHLDSEGKQQAAAGRFRIVPMLYIIEPLGLTAGMLRPAG